MHRIHPVAIVAALVLAVLLFAATSNKASAQFVSSAQSIHPVWPPRPQDIVNIDSTDVAPPIGNVAISANGSVQIYTVPANRWFVATDIEVFTNNSTTTLIEDDGTSVVTKRGARGTSDWNFAPLHSSVGIVFAPGSRLLLQEVGGAVGFVRYSVTGYLSPQ